MANKRNTFIFLNGPPRSGKDTIGTMLARSLSKASMRSKNGSEFSFVLVEKFAKPVKEGCHGLFNLTDMEGRVRCHDWYEDQKNKPLGDFLGMTPREAYIWYSEEVMKPKFGQNVFGRMMAARLSPLLSVPDGPGARNRIIIFTDSGFECEAKPVLDTFGHDNALLFRLRRDGTSYDGDSRAYIDLPIPTYDVKNVEGCPDDAHDEIEKVVCSLLGWR